MFRALIVAAVSTGAQASEDRYSLPEQIQTCYEVCESRGWRVLDIIQIRGHSRYYNWLHEIIRDCPEYGQVVSTIEGGEVDLVVVRDYDRLWRTDALRAQLMALCREHRVQILSVNQPVEPVAPHLLAHAGDSRLIVEAMSGVVAQMENTARARRSKMGKEAVVRRGRTVYSGNNAPYGYLKGEEGQLVVEPAQATWVRWIFEHRAHDRWGYRHIARVLTRRGVSGPKGGIWWDRTVKVILDNPIYIGHTHWGDAYSKEGQHEPLIPESLWNRAHRVDQQHIYYVERSKVRGMYVLTGLVRCGFCGYAMTYTTSGNGTVVLRCSHYLKTHGTSCTCNWHKAEPVEEYVFERVVAALKNPQAFLAARRVRYGNDGLHEEIERIGDALAGLDRRWQVWNDDHERGAISTEEMLLHRQRLLGQKGGLVERRAELESRLRAAEETPVREALEELSELMDVLYTLSPAELGGLYRRLIERIELRKGDTPVILWL